MSSAPAKLDLARARADTPGCATCTHFNNAGASLMPRPVIDAVLAHLRLETEIGGYEAAEQESDAVARVYDSLAGLIGASREEIAFADNATRAFDLAFFALPFARGDRILVGASDYISHQLAYRQLARRQGVSVEAVPEDSDGRLSLDSLAGLLDERVRLVTVDHVGTNSGTVQPVAEVGALLRETEALYLVDACQSLGQLRVDVDEVGCDILTATGRKYLRGPRGTGFLYVRRGLVERLEPPFPDVRGAWIDERGEIGFAPSGQRFETWEVNYAAKLGLGAAADYATGLGIDAIAAVVGETSARLRNALATVDRVQLLEPRGERSGLATFAVDGISAEETKLFLRARRINVSVSELTDTPTRAAPRGHRQWVRASAHYFNDDDEIERLVVALGELP